MSCLQSRIVVVANALKDSSQMWPTALSIKPIVSFSYIMLAEEGSPGFPRLLNGLLIPIPDVYDKNVSRETLVKLC